MLQKKDMPFSQCVDIKRFIKIQSILNKVAVHRLVCLKNTNAPLQGFFLFALYTNETQYAQRPRRLSPV